MSLDVYLTLPAAEPMPEPAQARIYVREGGATVEVTREEWDRLYPGREPVAVVAETDGREVYQANITHNMGRMAGEVGLYAPLWRPEENEIKFAAQLIDPLRDGLARLQTERDRLQEFNPENGWGNYDLLCRFVADYLVACERWPEAEVSVWA